jgi:trehalose-phosphatase
LLVAGADSTVRDLSELLVANDGLETVRSTTSSLPSPLERIDDLLSLVGDRRLAVFLDYDGTLTPIVSRPEDAHLSDEARHVLRGLAQCVPVTIVSGRDLRDVRDLVAVEGVFYAGSHGFEIVGPDGARLDTGPGERFLPALDRAERDLRSALDGITGVAVERKRFAVAVHFRRASDADVPSAAAVVDAVAARHAGLRRTHGKRVFELRPDVDWHKGTAVRHLLTVIGLGPGRGLPMYIGDDLTDEDAFLAIAHDGVPIVVRDEPRLTFARWALDSAAEVVRFLGALRESVARESRS